MRILHLLSQRPDSTGSGTYVAAMLREARARKHRTFLVAALESAGSRAGSDLAADESCFLRFSGSDVSFPIVGMSDVMPYPSRTFGSLSPAELDEYERVFAEALRQAVTAYQPDVIHAHHLWLMTSLARRLFPTIPIVASCHGTDLRQFECCAHLRHRVLAGCCALDAIVALTESQRAEIIQHYGVATDRVSVVGAGYDTALFFQAPKPNPTPVRIVYVGKLSRAKGVPWLLRALAQIDSPQWELHLVGGVTGAEGTECLALASALGSRVEVHGFLPPNDVASMMQQAHVLALPSLYEGLALVVLEGLAAGCRIVATDLPGLREVLGEVHADFISFVKPPQLHSVDQPVAGAASGFEDRLMRALHAQLAAAFDTPNLDLARVSGALAAYSWPRVFARVERVYQAIVSAT